MGKILNFPTQGSSLEDWAEKSTKDITSDTPVILAYKSPSGEVRTAYWSADLQTRQELLSHIQIDIIMGVVTKNLEYID